MRRRILAIAGAALAAAACTPTTPPPDVTPPTINEFVSNHIGSDTHEYVEVAGDASTDYDAYSLLVVEGDAAGAGLVDTVLGVGSTNGDGYFVTPFSADLLENGSSSLLLVRDAVAASGTDLDTDNDGTLDVTPGEIIDSVAVLDGGTADRAYGDTILSPGFDGGTFTVGGASRVPDRTDTDTAADWTRNDFDLVGIPGFIGTPTAGEAVNTPGAINEAVAVQPVLPMINEVDADQAGTDSAEFVELYADPNTPLDGMTLVLYNGSNDLSYAAIDLDGQSTDAGGHWVLCGNATTVPGCDRVVTPATDLVQNGQDAVALYSGDASSFPTGTPATATGLLDAVVYDTADADDPGLLATLTPGQPQIDENGQGDGIGDSNQRCPDGNGGRLVTTGYSQGTPTPGVANSCVPAPTAVTRIHAVQGTKPAPDPAVETPSPAVGDTTDDPPLLGQTVTIEGIVTGHDDLAGQSNAGSVFHNDRGLFVQEEDVDADIDTTTSEAVFVPFDNASDSVASFPVGTKVRVTGVVRDHFELTTVDPSSIAAGVTIVSPGNPLPTAVAIDETATRNRYESLEGMRVSLASAVANSGGTNKFGELFLTPGTVKDRVFRTEATPSLLALVADAGAGNPAIPRLATTPSSTFVPADLFGTVTATVGPLSYTFDHYKVMPQVGQLPTVAADATFTYPVSLSPAPVGQVRIAAFNVENFFPAGVVHDGAPVSAADYAEKRDRIVDAVAERLSRPDVVGMAEVNDLSILEDVAGQLGGYTAVLAEGNDNRGIDVGFLVKDTVTLDGFTQHGLTAAGPAGVTCSDIAGGLFDRPPLEVDITAGGTSFSVIMNHFSSKAAPDACRDAQAAFVRDVVGDIEGAGGEALVIGDLNAFEDESPLATLEGPATSLGNLWGLVPAESAYSFQFDGRLQTLDHILATDGLAAAVSDMTYAHFDNDVYDRHQVLPAPSNPDGHRVSDHDPPVVTLDLP